MFEFILLCLFILGLCTLGKHGGPTNHEEEWMEMWEREESQKEVRRHRSSLDESDSYFDHDGEEHLIDDDGYCEECDDDHDW